MLPLAEQFSVWVASKASRHPAMAEVVRALGLGADTFSDTRMHEAPPSRKTQQGYGSERTGWDSNPRYAMNVHKLSRATHA